MTDLAADDRLAGGQSNVVFNIVHERIAGPEGQGAQSRHRLIRAFRHECVSNPHCRGKITNQGREEISSGSGSRSFNYRSKGLLGLPALRSLLLHLVVESSILD